jgi:hypothetical protein
MRLSTLAESGEEPRVASEVRLRGAAHTAALPFLIVGKDGTSGSNSTDRDSVLSGDHVEDCWVGAVTAFLEDRLAIHLGMSASTIYRVLRRHDLSRLSHMDRRTATTIRRYERARPGELVHVDVKKLGKIPPGGGHKVHGRASTRPGQNRRGRVGYAYLHTAIDDYSRLA